MLSEEMKEKILAILREELSPAMGCTEPIALAFAGAKGREALGEMPEKVIACCSGNIIKNVRCVSIPNAQSMIGIEAAVALGVTGGDAGAEMEVLAKVTGEQRNEAKKLLENEFCSVELLESDIPLHILLKMEGREHTASVEIRYSHTNITEIRKDGRRIFSGEETQENSVKKNDCKEAGEPGKGQTAAGEEDRGFLTLERIKEFADTVELYRVKDMIETQIICNMKIAQEGFEGTYGLGIGKVILESNPESVDAKIKAFAAAASEARMGGCELPVIINSGSGNQGIASSVPVIVYARERGLPEENMYRALVFSALLTIWQKSYIGRLSAFCGAVSATCASGAAITYLDGCSIETIRMTIYNTLANTPGIICDGAKISCAAKIASGLDAALMAHHLAVRGKAYQPDSGILKKDMQETVSSVGWIGREGMRQTDLEILRLMLAQP